MAEDRIKALEDLSDKRIADVDAMITEHALDDQRRFATKIELNDLKLALANRFDRIEGRQDRNLDTILAEIRKLNHQT